MAETTKDTAVDNLASAIQSYLNVSTKASETAAPPKKEAEKKEDKGGAEKKQAAAYDRWNLLDDSTIDYGYLKKTGGAGIVEAESGQGYNITTAINYANGPAHTWHAYEAATSDVIARFQRLKGDQPAYFVTAADEHEQKIAKTAADQGKEPMDICNKVRKIIIIVE